MSYTLNNMTDYTDNVESEYAEELHDEKSESNNDAQDVEPCPYCEEPLPSPLPPKLEQYLSKLQKKKLSAVESYAFCMLHAAELTHVPEGIKKGYPTAIDF
ncbi:404_t:CDS:2, partial [Paraglomus occultum]